MKLDYDILENYLVTIRDFEKPFINTKELFEILGYSFDSQENNQIAYHYLHLLCDEALIEVIGKYKTIQSNITGHGTIHLNIQNLRLTALGHKSVEAMTNNKFWLKLKKPLNELGISGIKLIPALSIELLKSML
jgi:hypothetical protein